MHIRLAIAVLVFSLAGCAASAPDRPDSLDSGFLEKQAIVVGSISKPHDHDGFDTYSIDMLCPEQKQAYRFRVESSLSPVGGGFPADVVLEGREKTYFVRFVQPGSCFMSRHAVDITNTFTTYTFGQQGRLTRTFQLEAGDIVYLGEHEFIPRHDDDIFLWRDVVAPEYRIHNEFGSDLDALEKLFPDFEWHRAKNLQLELQPGETDLIEESDVWINPFGIF